MARTFDSQRLRHQRAMDRRLTEEHRALASNIGRIVLRYATGADRTVPNLRSTKDALKEAIWIGAIKPYYIGVGNDPFREADPQSPFARLLREGIEGAIRIQAERQAALLNRLIDDETVLAWLTESRPISAITETRGIYDPFHTWVDPNGYRLSDRVWRDAIQVRANVDRLLDYHIAQGTGAVRIAGLLEQYLTPAVGQQRTRTPYGTEGSYPARRLARTEITAAAGRATINASIANPFVNGIRWRLSASHPRIDICDEYARGGPDGNGVYAPSAVPLYPPHPHCLCSLLPVAVGNTADLVEELRRDITAATPRARRMQGMFNPDWLTRAILLGFIDEALEAIETA